MLQCEKPFAARGPVPNVACLPPASQVACAPVKGQLTVVPEKVAAVGAAQKSKEQKCQEKAIWWLAAIVLGVIVIGLVWNWVRMNNAKNAASAASASGTSTGTSTSTSSGTTGTSAVPAAVPGAVAAGAVANALGGAVAHNQQPESVTVNVDVYNQQPAVAHNPQTYGAQGQAVAGGRALNGIAGQSLPLNADRETAARYLQSKYPAGRFSDSTQSLNKSSDLEHCMRSNYGAVVLYSMRGCAGCEAVKPFMRSAASQLNVPIIDVERENINAADRPANYPFAFLMTPSQSKRGQLVHYPIDFSKTISQGGVEGLVQHINKIGCANGVKLAR